MQTIIKFIIFVLLILLGLCFQNMYEFYMAILQSVDIQVFLLTLIAGLFGFIIAVIPFTIQLLSIKDSNNFIKKINDEDNFNFYIKPMFNRFIILLKDMLWLFLFILFLKVIHLTNFNFAGIKYFNYFEKVGVFILMYIYIMLIYNFLTMLLKIIRDIESIVDMFIKTRTKKKTRKEKPK